MKGISVKIKVCIKTCCTYCKGCRSKTALIVLLCSRPEWHFEILRTISYSIVQYFSSKPDESRSPGKRRLGRELTTVIKLFIVNVTVSIRQKTCRGTDVKSVHFLKEHMLYEIERSFTNAAPQEAREKKDHMPYIYGVSNYRWISLLL